MPYLRGLREVREGVGGRRAGLDVARLHRLLLLAGADVQFLPQGGSVAPNGGVRRLRPAGDVRPVATRATARLLLRSLQGPLVLPRSESESRRHRMRRLRPTARSDPAGRHDLLVGLPTACLSPAQGTICRRGHTGGRRPRLEASTARRRAATEPGMTRYRRQPHGRGCLGRMWSGRGHERPRMTVAHVAAEDPTGHEPARRPRGCLVSSVSAADLHGRE